MTVQAVEILIAAASIALLLSATQQTLQVGAGFAARPVPHVERNRKLTATVAVVLIVAGVFAALLSLFVNLRAPRYGREFQEAIHEWSIAGLPGKSFLDIPKSVDINESFSAQLRLFLPATKSRREVDLCKNMHVVPRIASLGIQFASMPRDVLHKGCTWSWTWDARPMSEGKQIVSSSFSVSVVQGTPRQVSSFDGPVSTLQVTKPLAFDSRVSVASLFVTIFFSSATLVVSVIGLKKKGS